MRNRNPLQVNPNARGPRYVYERPRARFVSNLLRFGVLLLAILCLAALALPYLAQQGAGLPGLPARPTEVVVTATFTVEPTSSIPTATLQPSATQGPTPTDTQRAGFQYTVVEGDTLYSIALANELTIQQLAAANGKTSDSLSIGEVLTIPPPDYKLPTATPFPPDLQPGTQLDHVVLPGETLADIAAAYLTTVDEIIAGNEDVIIDGAAPPAGTVIIVRYGVITPTPLIPVATETPAS